MTTGMTELSRRGRTAYWVVAALAWAGVAATLIITAFDGYAAPTYVEEGVFAGAAHGWAGAPERLINCLSYFTELSNIMVAIISTLLARRGRVGAWGRAVHLCALMMITVTAIVYATLIGPYEVLSGFAGTAALAGPRGGIAWATLGRALLIPVAWVAYTLVRGTFTHQYPYGFVNVWRIGYAQVAINIVAILIGALVFMALFAGADWLIRKASRR